MRTIAPGSRLAALAALALALPLAGCPSLGGGTRSRVVSEAQFDDIPVPPGFAIDLAEGRSFSYTEGGSGPGSIRMGRLEYTGRGDVEALTAWYLEEMPRTIHGWSAGAEAPGGGSLYRRGDEACLVTLRPEGGGVRIVVERNTGGALAR
jgi:hypothetical protein